MTLLLPRLPAHRISIVVQRLLSLAPEQEMPLWPPEATRSEWSGQHASEEQLVELRQVVTDLAKRCGYPRSRHQKALAEFDLETTKVFADREELQSGEALRNDVWAYVSTVLLGHLTIWRFPSPPMDRLRGGPDRCRSASGCAAAYPAESCD